MTSGCVLKRCRNSYAQVNKNSGISYHTFPSDPIMKHKWVCIVQAERSENDWKPTTCSRICSEHFKEEDKYITFKGCIMRLKKTAVPAIPGISISINSINETESTQTRPYSNAERQRRYRERKKADGMNACNTSSESSDVQQQKQNDVNKIVDPTAHARNERKRHLNKLRQSRFRARQRFKSPSTSSQQAQKLITQEKYVDHNSHQDALEDLHSSDPCLSTDSCSQTILTTKKKIKKSFDLLEGEDDGILNLHTHVDIKQEDLEDIDFSVANPSSASCSQTNSACGSPTRESHIETFTEYEPQTTIDVTVMKEEPGSPLSDVSIHSDAADSPEEQEIIIKLRKKMKMLNDNEEILKRRCEEATILENKHKELLADNKYLQNNFKKKYKFLELNKL